MGSPPGTSSGSCGDSVYVGDGIDEGVSDGVGVSVPEDGEVAPWLGVWSGTVVGSGVAGPPPRPPIPGIDVRWWLSLPPVYDETARPVISSKVRIASIATTKTAEAARAIRFHGRPASMARQSIRSGASSASSSSTFACSRSSPAPAICSSACGRSTASRLRCLVQLRLGSHDPGGGNRVGARRPGPW